MINYFTNLSNQINSYFNSRLTNFNNDNVDLVTDGTVPSRPNNNGIGSGGKFPLKYFPKKPNPS